MIFELDGHCLFGFFKPNTNIHLLITFIYILAVLVKITISKKLAIRAAERVKQKKKTSLQNQQLIFKNMIKYETNQLKTNPTASFAKSTDTDAKPTVMHRINAS